jgi:hypothetical protein
MEKLHRIESKSLLIEYRSVLLELHRNFTTAHSISSTRTNFFIRVTYNPEQHAKAVGFGECGLPPKKPGCYLSDVGDCFAFMQALDARIKTGEEGQGEGDHEILQLMEEKLGNLQSELKTQVVQLINICHEFTGTEHFRAPKCAL